jgi:hypothetical protein
MYGVGFYGFKLKAFKGSMTHRWDLGLKELRRE